MVAVGPAGATTARDAVVAGQAVRVASLVAERATAAKFWRFFRREYTLGASLVRATSFRPLPADQSVGGTCGLLGRRSVFGDPRQQRLGLRLAQLDAPLVERVDSPDHTFGE